MLSGGEGSVTKLNIAFLFIKRLVLVENTVPSTITFDGCDQSYGTRSRRFVAVFHFKVLSERAFHQGTVREQRQVPGRINHIPRLHAAHIVRERRAFLTREGIDTSASNDVQERNWMRKTFRELAALALTRRHERSLHVFGVEP